MKNNDDRLIEENIKMLLKNTQELAPYNTALESMIMDAVEPAVNHAQAIARDRRLSKIGFWACIGLVILLAGFVIKDTMDAIRLANDTVSISSLFSISFSLIAILVLYIQVEWRRVA